MSRFRITFEHENGDLQFAAVVHAGSFAQAERMARVLLENSILNDYDYGVHALERLDLEDE